MTADSSILVVPPRTFNLSAPVSGGEHYIFSTKTGDVPSVELHFIPSAILSADCTNRSNIKFYIFDQDKNLKFSHGTEPFILGEIQDFNAGRLALIDDKFNIFNVCHFLLDKITRIPLFDSVNPDIYLCFSRNQYVEDVFAKLGKKAFSPFLDMAKRGVRKISIRIPELYVSSNSFKIKNSGLRHPAHVGAPWAIDFLRKSFVETEGGVEPSQPVPVEVGQRIFISRNKAFTRKILNQDEVDTVLEKYDFKTVFLEDFRFAEQVAIFKNANAVIGVHGAGLTNILFCGPKNTRVGEILPPLCATRAYWVLSNALGFEYGAFIAEDKEFPKPDYAGWKHQGKLYNKRNVLVNIKAFERFVKKMVR